MPNLSGVPGPCGGAWSDCAQSFTIVPPATIKFFEHTNYEGAMFVADADNPRLADSNWENRISSIQVPHGWKATLYSSQDYGGSSINLSADAPDFPSIAGPCGGTWNDCAASFRLRPAPLWQITKTHSGNFVRGTKGSYVIKVTNTGAAATAPDVGVEVVDTIPTGLTISSFQATGWNCRLKGSIKD
ncbi:MAG: peptidase inhibitor family I36 protein [Bryobacteraceae bacterium]